MSRLGRPIIGALLLTFSVAAASGMAWADEVPLSLPASELVLQDGQGARHLVGDDLKFEVRNPPVGAVRLKAPSALDEWDLNTVASPSSGSSVSPEADGIRLTVTPLKAGKLTLPTIGIEDGQGKWVGRTDPIEIEVDSSIPPGDPKAQVPAEPIGPVGLAFPLWVVVTISVLVLLMIAAGAVVLIRYLRRSGFGKRRLPPAVLRTEEEIAMGELAELEHLGLMARGQHKKQYFRASEILKRYVGARYRFDALERTSGEISSHLEKHEGFILERLQELNAILEQMDAVKFADQVPSAPEASAVLTAVRGWITKTRRPRMNILRDETESGGKSAV